METLFHGYTLDIAPGTFPLSTDSMVLADFVRLPKNAEVLDLGSGCGTIGLLLCAKDAKCRITGVELDENAHQTALENAAANCLESRLNSICADLTGIPDFLSPGSFDVCVSNPPYFTSGKLSQTVPQARHELSCSLEALMYSAGWALKYGGDFYLVHKPERLAELFVCAGNAKLEPKRICLLRHRVDGPVALVLLQLRKGGKPGLIWEDIILKDEKGNPSEDYKRIYHET